MKIDAIDAIMDTLVAELRLLRFAPPVSHVYNPLEYARKSHDLFFKKYGRFPREIVMVGMNPGPWGMAQTGVPFGEIDAVKNWMGIEEKVHRPKGMNPRRPVEGFLCKKSEVSGRRLWGWARERFVTPGRFFSRFMVINYCPLMFMEASGKNRTPDRLPKDEKIPLFSICDTALRRLVDYYQPKTVVGVGVFAVNRAKTALKKVDVSLGRITHPSPANPKANRGWAELVDSELKVQKIFGMD